MTTELFALDCRTLDLSLQNALPLYDRSRFCMQWLLLLSCNVTCRAMSLLGKLILLPH